MSKTQKSQTIIVSMLLMLTIIQKTQQLELPCSILTGCVSSEGEGDCKANLLYDNLYNWVDENKTCCCNDTGNNIQLAFNLKFHCSTLTGCISSEGEGDCKANLLYDNLYKWESQNKTCCCNDTGNNIQLAFNLKFHCSTLTGCISSEGEGDCSSNLLYDNLYFWKNQNKNCCCNDTGNNIQLALNGSFHCSTLPNCISSEGEGNADGTNLCTGMWYDADYFWKNQNKHCCCTKTGKKTQEYINKRMVVV